MSHISREDLYPEPLEDIELIFGFPSDASSSDDLLPFSRGRNSRAMTVKVVDHLPYFEVYSDLYGSGYTTMVPSFISMDQMIFRYLQVANLHSCIDRTKIAVLDDDGRVLEGPASFDEYRSPGQRKMTVHLVLKPVTLLTKARIYFYSRVQSQRNRRRATAIAAGGRRLGHPDPDDCCRRCCPRLLGSGLMSTLTYCVVFPLMVSTLMGYILLGQGPSDLTPQGHYASSHRDLLQGRLPAGGIVVVDDPVAATNGMVVHLFDWHSKGRQVYYTCAFPDNSGPASPCGQLLVNDSCLMGAVDMVPEVFRPRTPQYVLSLTHLSKAADVDRRRCAEEAVEGFRKSYGFKRAKTISRWDHLSNHDKARLEWIATNYRMAAGSGRRPLTGFLNWSPGSAKISYPVASGIDNTDDAKNAATTTTTTKVNGATLETTDRNYVRAYATDQDECLGFAGLLSKYLMALLKDQGSATDGAPPLQMISSPCHTKNESGSIDVENLACSGDLAKVGFVGYRGSGEVEACGRLLASLAESELKETMPLPLPGTRLILSTTGLGLARFIEGTASSAPATAPAPYSGDPGGLLSVATRVCGGFRPSQRVDPDLNGIPKAAGEGEDLCLEANLLRHLLVDVYGVGSRLQADVGVGGESEWTTDYQAKKSADIGTKASPTSTYNPFINLAPKKLPMKKAALYIFLLLLFMGITFSITNYFLWVDY